MNVRQVSALVLAAAAVFASAAHAGPDAVGAGAKAAQATAAVGPLKLLKTYFETDAPASAVNVGFTPYGSTFTVNCPGSAPACTIMINANMQLAAAATANPAAICLKVDGSYVNCPFNTVVPTSSYTVLNYQSGISVAPGAHTVSVEAYSSQSTTLHRYNTEVKLFKQ